ncbi:uncharacterized protein LOC112564593 [Pomacea canaliculata]|uniref:uncharacterized protein LOC112564593 n=1 Tax=Pomacea canaliculata TaxID=400727 RepID=UPI000D72CF40|nr:uncharacterized protein LOC112564593 [Pomacea canaliculata]
MTGRSEVVVVLVGMWWVASVTGDCTKLNSCSCQAVNGVIDLSPLKANSGAAFKDIQASGDNWLYSWNPCKDFTEKQCKTASACQFNQDKSDSHIIGTQDSATFSTVGSDVLLTYSAVESGVLEVRNIQLFILIQENCLKIR